MRNSGKQRCGMLPAVLLACAALTLANPIWAQRNMVTVPAGTSLLVRMIDTVDSSKTRLALVSLQALRPTSKSRE